jgi:hypothetical protein
MTIMVKFLSLLSNEERGIATGIHKIKRKNKKIISLNGAG